MIDILIRAYNEAIWLPQLFRSLSKQKRNLIRNILLLDNNSNDYPDKYGITNDIPDVSEYLVAKNENSLHDYHINYKLSPLNYKSNDLPLPKDYFLIDRDFHTPREGSQILNKEPVYNLARVDNTDYFLVETPDSIWRQVVPKD